VLSAVLAVAGESHAAPTWRASRPHAAKPTLKAGFAGILGGAFWGNRAALTFGGPRVMVDFDGVSAGFSFFPSLFYGKATDHELRPALGFGPELRLGHVVLFTPVYHLDGRYRPLVGLGYEF
jgi:hypothetical protein